MAPSNPASAPRASFVTSPDRDHHKSTLRVLRALRALRGSRSRRCWITSRASSIRSDGIERRSGSGLEARGQGEPGRAYLLCSLAADLHVTQTVDVTKGVHAMLPKSIFR